MHSVSSENERDFEMITNIQQKLIFDKLPSPKSTGEILNGLMQELNQIKAELTGKYPFIDLSLFPWTFSLKSLHQSL